MMCTPFPRDALRTTRMAASGWSTNATRALIAIWGEVNVLEKLDAVARNRVIYEENSGKMRAQGFDYS